MKKPHRSFDTLTVLLFAILLPTVASAQNNDACPRFPVGSNLHYPEALYSSNGVLRVNLTYETATDQAGRTLYCFMTDDGHESPTFHVNPGDDLIINLKNDLPPASPQMHMEVTPSQVCGARTMTASSVNMHFHGTNVSPACHSDDVIHTLVNPGQTFNFKIHFPKNEPPGLYWYHPHVHGISEAAVQGGASGAIVVDGIEKITPEVAGLPRRLLIVRDNNVAGNPPPGGKVPAWDVSLNYIPIPYPTYPPAVILVKPGEKEFWRVLNASADTYIDLELRYDGVAQPLQIVGLDGVPTGSQDGTRRGKIVVRHKILLTPAARAEFIITGPPSTVTNAELMTLKVDTGPDGDNDPTRPLAVIEPSDTTPEPALMPAVAGPPNPQRFEGLAAAVPTAHRTLYFSEVLSDPANPLSPTDFYITVDGATPTLFNPNNPPSITTTQGSVEDWTIQNRSLEAHAFHIHQIHFLLLDRDGVPVPPDEQQMLDMVQLPYWSGTGPYPSVTVRLDFRGPDTGDFVYHCHILGHEDNGMMAIIRVMPASAPAAAKAVKTVGSM